MQFTRRLTRYTNNELYSFSLKYSTVYSCYYKFNALSLFFTISRLLLFSNSTFSKCFGQRVNNRNVFRSTESCCPFDFDLDYEPRPVDSASLGKTRRFVSLIGNSHSVKSRIGRASPLTSFFRENSKEKRSGEILFFAP